jgi:hypothetical protein
VESSRNLTPRSLVITQDYHSFTPSFFGSSVVGTAFTLVGNGDIPYEHYSVNASIAIADLSKEISELANAINRLENTLSSLEKRIEALPLMPRPVRTLSEEDAKKEIKSFFEANHGEILYPSDVSDALNLDYEFVERIVWELENEGKIATADAAPRDESGR